MQLNNLSSSIDYTIDISREMMGIIGADSQRVPPYWCRTINNFATKKTRLVVSKYDNKNHISNQCYETKVTPEELRFPNIREKLIELYQINDEDLNRPFLLTDENGKKKLNVDWLKISSDFEEGEFDSEDTDMIMATRENKGVRIIATDCTLEEIKAGNVGSELPLSQILRAALYIEKVKGIKKPRYVYVVMYAIYNLLYHSVPSSEISPHIKEMIDDLYEHREIFLEKEKGQIDASMEKMKETIAPLIGGNKQSFEGIANQIDAGVGDLNEDTIDQIADQCHKTMAIFKNKTDGKKDLGQVIGDMIGGDPEKIKETMAKVGIHTDNIKALVDNMTGPGAMTNEELLATLPKDADNIDSIMQNIIGGK